MDGGPMHDYVAKLYGLDPKMQLLEAIRHFSRDTMLRHPRAISPDALPDLVTFADIKNPASVMPVDPNDLSATLGPGVKWHKITLEIVSPGLWPLTLFGITGEPLTNGIEKKLPWFAGHKGTLGGGPSYLDERATFQDNLKKWNFRMGM